MRVGFFSIAHIHMALYERQFRAVPGVTLVGAADDDDGALQSFCGELDVEAFESFDALVSAGLDAVVVGSANNDHLEHVRIAADAGLAILCEKPLATTVDDARAIVDICDAAGVLLMTAFPMRFSPALVALRDLIAVGELGEICAAVGINSALVPHAGKSWFSDPVRAGGGAAMDHVVHLGDALRWLLDDEVVEVYAQINRINHPELDVETGALVMLTFSGGVVATIDSSWSRPDSYPTWGGLSLDIIGSEGVANLDAFAQRLQITSNEVPHVRVPGWGDDTSQLMVNDFVAAVREGREPAVSGRDGLLATEIALAVYDSVAAGGPVVLTRS